MRQGSGGRHAEEISPFYWDIPERGFRWADHLGKTENARTEAVRLLVAELGPVRRRWPIREKPALFRIFADTPPTEDGIIGFASSYGSLGIAQVVTFPEAVIPRNFDGNDLGFEMVGYGEALFRWQQEIARLREAVDLWDAVRGNDYTELQRVLGGGKALIVERNFIAEVGDPSTVGTWPDVAADTRVAPHSATLRDTNLDRSLSQAEICQLAWHRVEQQITDQLRMLTEPCLVYSDSMQRPMLHLVPRTLLGALWLQLAWAIDGRKDFRKCGSCGDWFAVGHGEREFTTARVFCSDGCRVRENRRKKKARGGDRGRPTA
jgi:hypothetical protein